ncbi:NAD-specific glutamate dehydrogenase [compost metagenome]
MHLLFDSQALFGVQQALAIGVQGALHRFKQTLGVNLVLTQLASDLVKTGMFEGILEHAGDFAVGQTVGRLDLDA